jgi:hypothetical protein
MESNLVCFVHKVTCLKKQFKLISADSWIQEITGHISDTKAKIEEEETV